MNPIHPSEPRLAGASRALLILLGLGVFIGTLDQTVVVTILPNIINDIELPVAKFGQATWVVNGYLLGYTVAMPVIGRLADVYGHVRLYLICLMIFAAGSVAVALAPSLQVLVAARAFQAIGGGGILPVAIALAADMLPKGRRPLVLGALAATNNGSSLLGPLWGAVLVSTLGWRGIFWLNIPLVLPVAVVVPLLARGLRFEAGLRMDWLGAALLSSGLAAATLALTDDGANPRPLSISLLIGTLAVVLLALFVRTELRCDRPMISLHSFRHRHFSAAMLAYFLIGGALIVALVNVPLMANLLFHESALQGGLALMRLLLLLPIGGVCGGALCGRIGRRPTAFVGLVIAIAGFALVYRWPVLPSSAELWLSLGLIGLGLGFCDGPIVSTVLDSSEPEEKATAAALLLVLWTSGMIVGLALLGTQGLSSFSSRAARLFREQGPSLDIASLEHVMRQTFNASFIGAGVALLLALALVCLLEGGRDHQMHWTPVTAIEE